MPRSTSPDRITLVAIAIVAYAIANVVHEGIGHAAVCWAVGGKLEVLSSVHFDGKTPEGYERVVAAGGSIANALLGLLAFLLARRRAWSSATHYLLWLLMVINWLQASGYLLFSGVAYIGDWAAVIDGLPALGVVRALLALSGAGLTCAVVAIAVIRLGPFLPPPGPEQKRRARMLTLIPYAAGAALYLASGILNPVGPLLVAISAAPASLGGTSGLAWMAQMLRNRWLRQPGNATPEVVERNYGYWGAAAVVIIVFVGILGPGIRF